MSYTIENTYVGDGTTVLYSFTFEYIEPTDIQVSLDSVITTEWTFANATTVEFNNPPGVDVRIRIYRNTTVVNPKAIFYPGSAIRAQDLNDNFEQILYVTQEADVISERAEEAAKKAEIAADNANAAAEQARKDAADAKANADIAQEAAKQSAESAAEAIEAAENAGEDSAEALRVAAEAKAAAEQAAADAALAASEAEQAAADADAAEAAAADAQAQVAEARTAADDAAQAAADAEAEAAAAQAAADNAVIKANAADIKADQGISDAAKAQQDATTAISTANSAADAVSQLSSYDIIPNVASIPGNPDDQDLIKVTDSTGVQNFSPLSGLPGSFVGDNGISVDLRWSDSSNSWAYLGYNPTDPDDRYASPAEINQLQADIGTKLPLSGGNMTGNITLNPGVKIDGRDVGSDGSKLDGIEVNANKTTNNNQLTNGAGYVTSSGNTVIGTDSDISTPSNQVINTITLSKGVITAHTERNMTLANLGYTGDTDANKITNNNQLTNGAGYVTSSGSVAFATNATNAVNAEKADTATSANTAGSANVAGSATNATNTTNINVKDDNSSNSARYVTFTDGNGNQRLSRDGSFKYNPGLDKLYVGRVSAIATTTADSDDILATKGYVDANGGSGEVTYNGASAWCSVDASGKILGGLNIASCAQSGSNGETYDYTFATPMPDANYSVVVSENNTNTGPGVNAVFKVLQKTASGFRVSGLSVLGGVGWIALAGGHSLQVYATNGLAPKGGTGADAWVSCTGRVNAGEAPIEASFNIDRVVWRANGVYDVFFATPMPSSNYALFGSTTSAAHSDVFVTFDNQGTESFTARLVRSSAVGIDVAFSVSVHATNATLPATITVETADQILDAINNGGYISKGGDTVTGPLRCNGGLYMDNSGGSQIMEMTPNGNGAVSGDWYAGSVNAPTINGGTFISNTPYRFDWNGQIQMNTGNLLTFHWNNAFYYSIDNNAYVLINTASSDRKLKDILPQPTISGIDIVLSLKPARFQFKEGLPFEVEKGPRYGFIAQELQEVLPETVKTVGMPGAEHSVGKTYAEIEEGDEDERFLALTSDFDSQITAVLTKALQEAIQRIETLEAKVQTLENN